MASSALVFDPDTGQVYYSEDVDKPWFPGGLNQLMTAYLTFEAIGDGRLDLSDEAINSENARKQPPAKFGFPVGATVPVSFALKGIIVKSANDMAIVLAEKIAGSEENFVQQMNAKAKELGMSRSHFYSPWGAHDDGQMVTARDMGILTRALLKDFPQFSALFASPDMRLGKRILRSPTHNALKGVLGADGIKGGFMCQSGFHLVASATRNGQRRIAITLGHVRSNQRGPRASELLDLGFANKPYTKADRIFFINTLPRDSDTETPPKDITAKVCPGRHRSVGNRKDSGG